MHKGGAPYRASSDYVDRFLTMRVDPLEEGHITCRVWPNRCWPPCGEPRGLETKVLLKADLVGSLGICSLVWPVIWGERLLWNRALVWCFTCIDYEMLELGFDDLVMGSRLYLWSPTIALHVLLNSDVEAALMCVDSIRLPGCARTPHDGQRHSKPLKFLAWSFGSSLFGRTCVL
ncbi:hypothetical protein M9H77_08072 [Catharanthus roseus]|uniref:Uncharacterized protein n=1 Tax=Catharanthus roseus TaxID=4058 RepID=A0ACC0BWP1_CATRO|nr:hypothetical protein M9H77_08072 [Catharanthus roseus]